MTDGTAVHYPDMTQRCDWLCVILATNKLILLILLSANERLLPGEVLEFTRKSMDTCMMGMCNNSSKSQV